MNDNQKKLNEQLLNVVLSDKDSDEAKLKKVKYLVRLGADVNQKVNGKSLLKIAREKGYKEIEEVIKESLLKSVDELLDGDKCENVLDELRYFMGGKDVVSKDEAKKLGMQIWKSNRCLRRAEEIEDLIQKGADINVKDGTGETPLFRAVFNGEMDAVKVLLKHGADVNQKNDDGYTALMWAAYKGSKDIVQMLLEKGADVNIKNNYGSRVWVGSDREIVKVINEHIKKTGGEPYNDGGILGRIFDGFGRY